MKKAYKQLQKKLKNQFTKVTGGVNYSMVASVAYWVSQCGITPSKNHTNIICKIFGGVPYPYQELDRLVVLDYLKKHKYKEFKNVNIHSNPI